MHVCWGALRVGSVSERPGKINKGAGSVGSVGRGDLATQRQHLSGSEVKKSTEVRDGCSKKKKKKKKRTLRLLEKFFLSGNFSGTTLYNTINTLNAKTQMKIWPIIMCKTLPLRTGLINSTIYKAQAKKKKTSPGVELVRDSGATFFCA